MSPADASTIRTLLGSRCRNSSRRSEASMVDALSPRSCSIRRSSCVGVRSPSSSAVSNCWRRFSSEALVRRMSCAFSVL
ncbi:hypothetical protein ISCGN_006859 [Ixodes scapularis]